MKKFSVLRVFNGHKEVAFFADTVDEAGDIACYCAGIEEKSCFIVVDTETNSTIMQFGQNTFNDSISLYAFQ